MGDESFLDLFGPVSIFCHPTTGRAGWGADVHFMGQESNMKSAVIRMLERLNLKHLTWLRGKFSIYDFIGGSLNRQPLFYAAPNLSLVAYNPKGCASIILRTSIITFDAG